MAARALTWATPFTWSSFVKLMHPTGPLWASCTNWSKYDNEQSLGQSDQKALSRLWPPRGPCRRPGTESEISDPRPALYGSPSTSLPGSTVEQPLLSAQSLPEPAPNLAELGSPSQPCPTDHVYHFFSFPHF